MTIEDLRLRHSVRNFKSERLDANLVNSLKSETTFINTHEAGLNFQLCLGDSAPFKSMLKSYGSFTGVENYLAAIIDPTFPHAYERAGYYAMQFLLMAFTKGLGSCIVGVTFDSSKIAARMEVYEKLPFVVAFGYPAEKKTLLASLTSKIAHIKKRTPRDFFDGTEAEYQHALKAIPYLSTALEAVATAPSALNKQPVRLAVTSIDGKLRIVAHTPNDIKFAVELGIAKCCVASVIDGDWDWGENAPFFPIND